MDRCHRSLFALTCVVAMSIPAQARAGNNYDVLPGARAALLGGAYTALAEDGSASYWNPAGLGWIQYPSFDVSGSAYEFRWFRIPGYLSIVGGGQPTNEADLTASQMLVIPTLASYVFPIYRKPSHSHVLGVSIMVLASSDISEQFSIDDNIQGAPVRSSVDLALAGSIYAFGPTYGVRIGKYVSVGCSLMFQYVAALASQRQRFAAGDPNAPTGVEMAIVNADAKNIGLQAVFGAQFRPWRGLRLGVTLRTPVMFIYSIANAAVIAARFGPGVAEEDKVYEDRQEETSEFRWDMGQPFSISVGVGYESPKRWAVAFDFDYFGPLSDENYKQTFNARAGAEIFLKENWAMQFGFFTDLDNQKELQILSANYFGLVLGVTWRKLLCEGDKRWIKFIETTFGLKYVFGLGDAAITTLSRDTALFGLSSTSFTEHDIGLIVGSRLNF